MVTLLDVIFSKQFWSVAWMQSEIFKLVLFCCLLWVSHKQQVLLPSLQRPALFCCVNKLVVNLTKSTNYCLYGQLKSWIIKLLDPSCASVSSKTDLSTHAVERLR